VVQVDAAADRMVGGRLSAARSPLEMVLRAPEQRAAEQQRLQRRWHWQWQMKNNTGHGLQLESRCDARGTRGSVYIYLLIWLCV
jgi:hypothetical protein